VHQSERIQKLKSKRVDSPDGQGQISYKRLLRQKEAQLLERKAQTHLQVSDVFELDTHISQLKNQKQNTIDQITSANLQIDELSRANRKIDRRMQEDLFKANRNTL
jgi:outer membrane murein-binding lipoprotein Lpp